MPKRILVVDDNASIRGLVREFIEARRGSEICGEATDGAEGIQKGRELKPDLIVIDFMIPRISGLQAVLILHEIVPKTPIILFTFHKEALPMDLAQAAGVSSIISKTDQLASLADEVQRLTHSANWLSLEVRSHAPGYLFAAL
jgi:two-component system chemotaxis response regulator CheY